MRLQVRSLALLNRLRIRHCHELWCRSQTRFRSHVAVALMDAGGCSSDLTPTLGTSMCHGSGSRKGRKTQKKKSYICIYPIPMKYKALKHFNPTSQSQFTLYCCSVFNCLAYHHQCFTPFFFFFFLFFFLGPHPQHLEVPRLGVNQSYSCWPTPQP